MGLVTANAWERVVKLQTDDGALGGAGTIIEHGERTYCVTARHVLPAHGEISLWTRFHEWRGEAFPIEGVHPEADVAIFSVPDDFAHPDLPLPTTSDGVIYSQDVFFLGYPYGLAMRGGGADLLPFVKRATLSSSDLQEDGLHIWYLDGLNNPGFSGGPVVAHPGGNQGQLQFVAVISGYRADWQDVQSPRGEAAGRVAANSGIVFAYDVKHAIDVLPSA